MMNGTNERQRVKDSSTIKEYIKQGKKKTLTHYNSSILATLSDDNSIEYPIQNVLYEYMDELNNMKTPYDISDSEMLRYKMRPDLFCYDKYGNTDIEWVILAINNMMSPKDFTIKNIYYIDPTYMSRVVGMIVNAENDYITANRNNYTGERF